MINVKKYLCIGPGGMGCPCCFDGPRSKGRKYKFRVAKRKEHREAMKIENDNREQE